MPVNDGNQTVPTVLFPDGSDADQPAAWSQVQDRLETSRLTEPRQASSPGPSGQRRRRTSAR